jgi:hypothetical protein
MLYRRWRVFTAPLAVLGPFVALFAHTFVQQFRWIGELNDALEVGATDIFWRTVDHIGNLGGEFSLSSWYVRMIDPAITVANEGNFSTLQRMATFWLPSSMKPANITHSVASAFGQGEGASVHPTIYGLAWVDGLWAGLLYAPVLAVSFWLLDLLHRHYVSQGRIVWCVLAGTYCSYAALAARGSLSNGWVVMCVSVTVILVLAAVSNVRLSLRSSSVRSRSLPHTIIK